jgi:hypothetical protein
VILEEASYNSSLRESTRNDRAIASAGVVEPIEVFPNALLHIFRAAQSSRENHACL